MEEEIIGPPRPVRDSGTIGPPKPTKKRKRNVESSEKKGEEEEKKSEGEPPKKKPRRDYTALLEQLPSQPLYEFSLNHISEICHIATTPQSEFVITISTEGYMKLWKRSFETIEIVKSFRVSPRPVLGLATNQDGTMACLVCILSNGNGCLKTFDIKNVAISNVVKLDFPLMYHCVEYFTDAETKDWRVVVSKKNSSSIHVIDPLTLPKDSKGPVVATLDNIHRGRNVVLFKWNKRFEVMISCDSRGVIEYWSTNKRDLYEFPSKRNVLRFQYKSQTDLYALAKAQTTPTSLSISPDCTKFALTARDRNIRVFDFQSGKMIRLIDESVREIQRVQATSDDPKFTLHGLDFGKRMEVEKQVELMWSRDENVLTQLQREMPLSPPNAVFDGTGRIVIYGTPIGLKFVEISSGEVIKILGKHEQNLRFLSACLFLGRPTISRHRLASISSYKKRYSVITSTTDSFEFDLEEDPLLLCTAYGKNRFYVFSKRMFEEDVSVKDGMTRDKNDESELEIISYRPSTTTTTSSTSATNIEYDEDEDEDDDEEEEEEGEGEEGDPTKKTKKKRRKKKKQPNKKKKKKRRIPRYSTIHTEMGDIRLRLYYKECPVTVRNFVDLSKSGYYNGVIFHRVIRNFMIQTGDPQGDGTGGQSSYGRHFQDEIRLPELNHSEAYMLSMANKGVPNTNGSQFFITLAKATWLDGKHTVFGNVVEGKNVVNQIGSVRTSRYEKPYQDIKIISVSVFYEDEEDEDEDDDEEENIEDEDIDEE